MPTCLPQTARKVDGREADVARLNQAGQYLFLPGAGFFYCPLSPPC
ncbi:MULTISPECIES: hypothetical protein [Eikenella]|nr:MULTISPECIES: hypothetical protein [Eikenella]